MPEIMLSFGAHPSAQDSFSDNFRQRLFAARVGRATFSGKPQSRVSAICSIAYRELTSANFVRAVPYFDFL